MAAVTNQGRTPRVVALATGRHVTLAAGETRDLDLAVHPVHDAWISSGFLQVAAIQEELPPPPATKPVTVVTDEEPASERKHQRRTAHGG